MPRPYRQLILFVFVVTVWEADAAAQTAFSLDAHAYLDDDNRPSMRVTATVPHSSLVFVRRGDQYESSYTVYVRVLDKDKRVVDTVVSSETVVVDAYSDTRSSKLVSRHAQSFVVGPDTYNVECIVRVKNTHLSYERKTSIVVPNLLEGGIGLGKPRLSASDVDTSGTTAVLRRPRFAREFEENEQVTNRFNDMSRQPALLFDVYLDRIEQDSIASTIAYQVLGDDDTQVLYGRRRVNLTGKRDLFVATFDVGDWEPADYVFEVSVTLRNKNARQSLPLTLGATRAMLDRQLDKTLEILSLIAPKEDVDAFRSASISERVKLWQGFWLQRDPTPGTEENEALGQYVDRVHYVEENFSAVGPGWQSDRGRVYIVHGEPDEIRVQADPQFQGEYLIWRYYEENLEFVFYDRFGLGEYRLSRKSGF